MSWSTQAHSPPRSTATDSYLRAFALASPPFPARTASPGAHRLPADGPGSQAFPLPHTHPLLQLLRLLSRHLPPSILHSSPIWFAASVSVSPPPDSGLQEGRDLHLFSSPPLYPQSPGLCSVKIHFCRAETPVSSAFPSSLLLHYFSCFHISIDCFLNQKKKISKRAIGQSTCPPPLRLLSEFLTAFRPGTL